MNKKGFTLVEVIAAIAIMSVLLLIAVPAVSSTITNSRKNTFWQDAKNKISSAKAKLLNKEFEVDIFRSKNENPKYCKEPPLGWYTKIPTGIIDGKSYNDYKESVFGYKMKYEMIIAANVGTNNDGTGNSKVVYFYAGIDNGNNGIINYVSEGELSKESVSTNKDLPSTSSLNFPISLVSPRGVEAQVLSYKGKKHNYYFYAVCGVK